MHSKDSIVSIVSMVLTYKICNNHNPLAQLKPVCNAAHLICLRVRFDGSDLKQKQFDGRDPLKMCTE